MTNEIASGALASPAPLAASSRWRILLYLSLLIFLVSPGAPYHGLIDLPISFFLKNKLHLKAHEVADFRLMSALPLYFAFVFGFARDRFNPLGMRDRGFLIIFGLATAALYVAFAFMPASYWTLLGGVVIVTCSYLFVSSAWNGLTSTIGQQHVMSGQISAMLNVIVSIPGLLALLFGGLLSNRLEGDNATGMARILFLTGAAIMVLVAAYGAWRPRVVYDNLRAETHARSPLQDLKRLVRHWPVWPALLIWFLWNFAPGSTTPLQYYIQDTLHAPDSAWGEWNAIFAGSFIPTFLLYGVLCRKFPLRTLLWWGTIFAVPQFIPLLFVHSVTGALIAAAPIGLMGGVASAAYIDLLIRSCPRGLQGTILMASTALYWLVSRAGDVLGTNLYDRFGSFTVCVVAITVVYALILPTLLLIPKRIIATADGEVLEGGFDPDEPVAQEA
ncbi:MAG: MFS transporter [Caulobacteraceae bacterium]